METSEPVPESATRKDLVAVRTAPVAFDVAMDPDSSSTSITLIPQRSTRSGFVPGPVTLSAFFNV